ncbi:MAG: glycosyltransferase [Pseudomonadota bacterium]
MRRVTVLMSVYRAASTVAAATDSILNQTFGDFEFLIIDNGAAIDGTSAVLNTHLQLRNDPRIKLIVLPENNGLAAALNEGLAQASAPLIARMDADDIALPQRLEKQVRIFEQNLRLGALGSDVTFIDVHGNIFGRGRYPVGAKENIAYLKRASSLAHPAVMMRRNAVLKVGGYRPAFENAEDYDLWLRLADHGYEIDNIPEVLLFYRLHGANTSQTKRREQALRAWLARAFHVMRSRDMPDPEFENHPLDESALSLVAEDLKQSFDIEMLELMSAQLSLQDESELHNIVGEVRKLQLQGSELKPAARILLRAALGFARNKNYLQAGKAFLAALSYDVPEIARMMAAKAAGLFR